MSRSAVVCLLLHMLLMLLFDTAPWTHVAPVEASELDDEFGSQRIIDLKVPATSAASNDNATGGSATASDSNSEDSEQQLRRLEARVAELEFLARLTFLLHLMWFLAHESGLLPWLHRTLQRHKLLSAAADAEDAESAADRAQSLADSAHPQVQRSPLPSTEPIPNSSLAAATAAASLHSQPRRRRMNRAFQPHFDQFGSDISASEELAPSLSTLSVSPAAEVSQSSSAAASTASRVFGSSLNDQIAQSPFVRLPEREASQQRSHQRANGYYAHINGIDNGETGNNSLSSPLPSYQFGATAVLGNGHSPPSQQLYPALSATTSSSESQLMDLDSMQSPHAYHQQHQHQQQQQRSAPNAVTIDDGTDDNMGLGSNGINGSDLADDLSLASLSASSPPVHPQRYEPFVPPAASLPASFAASTLRNAHALAHSHSFGGAAPSRGVQHAAAASRKRKAPSPSATTAANRLSRSGSSEDAEMTDADDSQGGSERSAKSRRIA